MLKFGILGLGQAGSNIAEYAITKSLSELNSDEIDAFIRQLEDL